MSDQTTDPRLSRLLAVMDETGWGGYVTRRRCHDLDRIGALARLGIVSSSNHRRGEEEWRLNLTRTGQALRRALLAQEARDAR